MLPDVDPSVNKVTIDRTRVPARYDKHLNRFVRAAIPFAYGFFHIETCYHLRVVFHPLSRGTSGSFGYSGYNDYRTLVIFLSNEPRHLKKMLSTFFHEMTHFWQFMEGRNNPLEISYYRRGRFIPSLYRKDPLEIEARSLALLMEDQYARYRSNYRWNVPYDAEVVRGKERTKIFDPRFPLAESI